MDAPVATLLLPFEAGDLTPPAGDWAFLNAVADGQVADRFAAATLTCEQPMRPAYVALERSGFAATAALADAPPARFDGVLVLLGRHRRLNEARIARANRLARPGAPVVVAGDNRVGPASARKWCTARTAVRGGRSKHHARVFWLAADAAAFADVGLQTCEPVAGLVATPGMFSADAVDAGSARLAAHIDARVSGRVADFGAGWGYLSAQVLRHGRPASIDLIEADRDALDRALVNLAPLAGDVPLGAHWRDATCEPLPSGYDWIVMNPPFHEGRRAEPGIGRQFIAAAARALAPRGRLLMVANAHLPYEAALGAAFSAVRQREAAGGFKVIEAAGPRR